MMKKIALFVVSGFLAVAGFGRVDVFPQTFEAGGWSLEIASGVTVQVRTLTVGGVQKPHGDYTFGSGTLRVSHPCGFVLCVK